MGKCLSVPPAPNLTGVLLGVLLTCGIFSVHRAFLNAFGVRDERVVQILESADGKHKAELIRRVAFLDLNFFIQVDGKAVFTSSDFPPTNKVPLRETLFWDKTGRNLVFEVAEHRLFGYDVTTAHQLSNTQLPGLKVDAPTLESLGYEGDWPD